MTSGTTAHQTPLFFTISLSLLKLMCIESVMLSYHLTLCRPFSSCPQSFPASFSSKSALGIRGPKHWSFSFSIGPSNEYSGLISFRIDWFDILAVQGRWSYFLDVHSDVWHSFRVISYIPKAAIFLLGVMTVVPVSDIGCPVRTGLIYRLAASLSNWYLHHFLSHMKD